MGGADLIGRNGEENGCRIWNLVVCSSTDAKRLASGPISPVTAAESHVDALEEWPFQRFRRSCLSYPLAGRAKAAPSDSCMKCGKSCCKRLNSVVLMSRYFDPSHLHSVKGSSYEWAKSQTVLS